MTRKKLVSVVIATIGSEHLSETISSLNKGKLIPDEILICIPKNIKINKLESRYNNIKILNCPKRGQVAQRIFGFKNAKNELVLQLDDDVILQKTCLYILVKYIERHQSSSVGPQIYDAVSKKYTSFLIPHNNEYNIFNTDTIIYYIVGSSTCTCAYMEVLQKELSRY